jgi:hypothetical protein
MAKTMQAVHGFLFGAMLQIVKKTTDRYLSAGAVNYFEVQCIQGLPCRDSAKSSPLHRPGALPEEA